MGTGTATRRGRPRDPDLHRRLLQAALELLLENGYDRLSLESVAARGNVGRPTLYRRWPDKNAVVLDVIGTLRWELPTPNTGNLRDDLVALAGDWNREDAERDAVISGLLPAMTREPALREAVMESIGRPRGAAFAEIIDRAVERGEAKSDPDTDLLGAIFPSLAFHRLNVLNRPIDERFVVRVVDHVLVPLITGHSS